MTAVTVVNQTCIVEVTEANRTTTVYTPLTPTIITATTVGPQGPPGPQQGALPTGGDPGSVLLKSSNDNYAANWIATIDGGTFN